MERLSRREILEELKRLGIDSLYKLKLYCREFEEYARAEQKRGNYQNKRKKLSYSSHP